MPPTMRPPAFPKWSWPMSTFDPVCSLVTETGRVTVSERLLIRTHDGVRDELVLADDAEVLTAYRTNVGIELGRSPAMSPP